jgi:hypothetical protein
MKKLLFIILFCLFTTQGWCATVTWQGDDLTNPTYWNDADNWDTGTVPANGDDVVMANAANCEVNEATSNLKSFDMTGYTGTLSGTSAITVIGAASATNVVKFAGTITWTGVLNLNPTAVDTIIQLTSNGKTLTSITINGSSGAGYAANGVVFMDGVSFSNRLTLTAGSLHTDGASDNSGLTHTFSSSANQALTMTGTGTRTLNLGNSIITIASIANPTTRIDGSNITITPGNSSITFSGLSSSNSQIQLSSYTWYDITWTGGQTGTSPGYLSGNFTCHNLTLSPASSITKHIIQSSPTITNLLQITGNATKTYSVQLNGTVTTLDADFDGNSAINRLFITSETLGTHQHIANTNDITGSNVDFRDITLDNATDLSAITGGSGDCGGNTGVTFTTADDWYWNGSGTRNFSNYTYWYDTTNGGGTQMASTRCPLPQDTCYIDGASIDAATTITQDLPRVPSLDFTSAGSFTFTMNYSGQQLYGNLILSNSVTFSCGVDTDFYGLRGSHSINMSGKIFGVSNNSGVGITAFGATYTLLSNLDDGFGGTYEGNFGFNINNGTFDANDFSIHARNLKSDNSNTRVVYMGSGTWKMYEVGTSYHYGWYWGGTNLTLYCETSTVEIYGSFFNGGGKVYNNINILTNANTPTFIDSNTFSTFTINAPKTVKFTKSTTTTVGSFVATGTAGNLITLDTADGLGTFTLSDTTGTNSVSYCDIHRSTVAGGATWNAYTSNGNIDGGSNTGWNWESAVTTDYSQLMMISE